MPQTETPRMREAYREYLKLGINRSMEALHERLTELWVLNVPTVGTLRDWAHDFGWTSRILEDDELINRRAMDRIRDRLATDIQRRQERRLRLSDIQLQAALKAMVRTDDEGHNVPIDITRMDPRILRAVNDTVRLASETQRLDQGQATSRAAGEEMSQIELAGRTLPDAIVDELARFIGLVRENEDAEDEVEETHPGRALPPPPMDGIESVNAPMTADMMIDDDDFADFA